MISGHKDDAYMFRTFCDEDHLRTSEMLCGGIAVLLRSDGGWTRHPMDGEDSGRTEEPLRMPAAAHHNVDNGVLK